MFAEELFMSHHLQKIMKYSNMHEGMFKVCQGE